MDAQFRDRGLYLPDADALVIADLHVGRDASSAVEMPLGEREDLTERLGDLLATFDPEEVVVAGDLLHAFDRVPEGVEETLADLLGTVTGAGADLVVVRGNHDSMLNSVLDSLGVDLRDEYRADDTDGVGDTDGAGGTDGGGDTDRAGDTVVHHGHEEPDAGAGTGTGTEAESAVTRYVVGHDHPAIEIEGARHACLLYGPEAYRGEDLFVLPAFNRLAPGTTVNGAWTSDFQSPVVTDADSLQPVVWDSDASETLSFPPLGKLRRML